MHSDAVPLPAGPGARPGRHGRLAVWARRTLAGLAGLLVAGVASVVVLASALDQPWLKRRVQALIHGAAGVDVDYAALRIGLLSGIELEGLVVRSPPELRAVAPELVRIGRLTVRWSPRALLHQGPPIDRVTVSDVAVTIVVDASGRTSFDGFATPNTQTSPAPAVPLSRQAAVLQAPPPVASVDVDNVSVALIRTDGQRIAERTTARGIALAIASEPAPTANGWRVSARLGDRTSPLDLVVRREVTGAPDAAGEAKIWIAVDASPSQASVALDLRVLEQTLVADAPKDPAFHAEATADFDPAAGRTTITVHDTRAGDGVAMAEASLEVPDRGDPLVRRARGDVDLVRLLSWAPPGLVPVTADRAEVHYRVESLVAGAVPRLSEGGSVAVDATLSGVTVRTAGAVATIGEGTLSLNTQPAEGAGMAARGKLELASLRLEGAERVGIEGLVVELDGRQGRDGTLDGQLDVRCAHLAVDGPSAAAAQRAHVALRVGGLHVDPAAPLAARGDLAVSLEVPALDVRSKAGHVVGDSVSAHLHTLLAGRAPYAADAEVAASRLRASGADGAALADAPLHIQATVRDATPDLVRPAASRGVGHVALTVGDLETSLDAKKESDAVDFAVHLAARSLGAIRPFAPGLDQQVPLDRIGVVIRSSGRVEHLAGTSPDIQEATEIEVDRPAYGDVAASAVTLALKSRGGALQHEGEVDLRAKGLIIGAGAPSDDHLTVSGALDRVRRSMRIDLQTEGHVAAKLALSASFDAARRAVPYSIDARVGGLTPAVQDLAKAHGVSDLDLAELEVAFSSHGTILGLVTGVGADGSVQWAPRPSATAGVEGTADLQVGHLHWARGDDAVIAPKILWHGDLHSAEGRRALDSHLEIGTLHLDLGPKDVDVTGLRDDTSVALAGDLREPTTHFAQHLTVGGVAQDLVPEYGVGDVALTVTADREANGVIHVDELKLSNAAGGTNLSVSGNVELGARRTFSVTTALEQDLLRLSGVPERFTGRGTVELQANIVSPDLSRLRVQATLKAHDVSAAAPRAGIELEKANGEIPIAVALEMGKDGLKLRRDEARSPYSMLRFTDQHPLLSRSGFVSIARIKSPYLTIAPLVGNLEIEQRMISLRQFEMGVRGGTITGQCGLNWNGPQSTIELHVRATGVQSSHGEPFDGNIAVVISPGDRTVEGRAEILRIGERHLLDLLDMQDPTHVDPAMNRVRTALLVGYPDRLRLVFDHGFASARLELGGLAHLVSISEIRGIPMGPLVDKLLAPPPETEGAP